ncbi:MAG: hypothetical protein WCT07_03565 [Candidatus Paceibacterota bacterium]|jgi:hypothetical protein
MKKKNKRGHATVTEDEGVNYREIAETMTELGFSMNHSSARNHVLRVMRKFVATFTSEMGEAMDERKIDMIAKSPEFQVAIAGLLHIVEAQRRDDSSSQHYD